MKEKEINDNFGIKQGVKKHKQLYQAEYTNKRKDTKNSIK